MRHLVTLILLTLTVAFNAPAADVVTLDSGNTEKKERNFIKNGNIAYNDSLYDDAIELYRKALTFNSKSEVARYNIANAQLGKIRQYIHDNDISDLKQRAGAEKPNITDEERNFLKLVAETDSLYFNLMETCVDNQIKEFASYNSGNLQFYFQDYPKAIERYKAALRLNPGNDKARRNLRIAQLRLPENDQQQQDNEQDNEQEQNQEQQQKDQQQDNKNDQKEQQDQQNQQPNQQQNQQQQQQQNISPENASQMLDAIEKAEQATRARVQREEERKSGTPQAGGRGVLKPW